MQHTIGIAAIRPHKYQSVLTVRDALQCLLYLLGVLDRLAVYFEDHFPALEAGILR
jgi:hypothetical protein